jgi:hypothetical protein
MSAHVSHLVDRMAADVRAWSDGGAIDLPTTYGAEIAAFGAVPFFSDVFARHAGSELDHWMLALAPLWTDLPYADWREVLRRIANDRLPLYHFVAFTTTHLGLDAVAILESDPAVPAATRRSAREMFPGGGGSPGAAWIRDRLAECGVDQRRLWDRLHAEGAPMRPWSPSPLRG